MPKTVANVRLGGSFSIHPSDTLRPTPSPEFLKNATEYGYAPVRETTPMEDLPSVQAVLEEAKELNKDFFDWFTYDPIMSRLRADVTKEPAPLVGFHVYAESVYRFFAQKGYSLVGRVYQFNPELLFMERVVFTRDSFLVEPGELNFSFDSNDDQYYLLTHWLDRD